MAKSSQVAVDAAALLAIVAVTPEGLLIEAIASHAAHLDRRTLQRRLQRLIQEKRLTTRGRGRSTRYQIVDSPLVIDPDPGTPKAESEKHLELSRPAADILALVTRPQTARTPVGYDETFLNAYQPNRTAYLTGTERRNLRQISELTTASELPAGTFAQQILGRLLIDLSWNSSRLEGNTYSLLDTERLLDIGESGAAKTAAETQMILNHKAAIEMLVQAASAIRFDRYTILSLHALLSENLLPNARASGRLRTGRVGISGSVFHPLETPQRIETQFDRLLAIATAIEDPFEQAFFALVQFPYLQPFDDVNKRVSRLAANIPLIRANLSPLAFIDVPTDLYTRGVLGVYELKRVDLLKDVFLWAYGRSAARYGAVRQSIGEPDTFRLRHRNAIKEVVGAVMQAPMDKRRAATHITAWAKTHIATAERAKFVEVVETELLDMHDGNFARYRTTPKEFEAWSRVWNPAKKP